MSSLEKEIRFIRVQISPKRWVVAERFRQTDGLAYSVITNPIATAWEAEKVRSEIAELEPQQYSNITNRVLNEDITLGK